MSVLKALTDFADSEWVGAACGGVLALFNGKSAPLKYEPESEGVKTFGLWLPQTEMTAVGGAGGTLEAGTYLYTYVEVDSRADEGSGLRSGPPRDSEGVEVAVAANGSVTLTIPSQRVNEDADKIWVYRTLVDGSWPTLGRITELDWYDTTYTDDGDTPDFSNYPLDQNKNPPPNQNYPFKMNRRLMLWGGEPLECSLTMTIGSTEAVWAGGDPLDAGCVGMTVYAESAPRGYVIDSFLAGSPGTIVLEDAWVGTNASTDPTTVTCRLVWPSGRLSWSEPDDYANYPAANVRYVEKSAADPETGGAAINGRGLLFTAKKTFGVAFDTTPALGWGSVYEVSNTLGCLSHRTIQECSGVLMWLTEGGIAASTGGPPRIISDEIAPEFEDIRREDTGRCRDAFAINWQAKQRYICFVPQVADTVGCSKAIVCDYKAVPGLPKFRFSIYTFTKEFTCATVEIHAVASDDGTNYFEYPVLGDQDGYVWTFGTGDADGTDTAYTGTVDSASTSPTILEDTDATFDTDGIGLAGMMVTVERASDGTKQHLLIASNNANQLRLDQEWSFLPVSGDSYWVGGIHSFYETPWSAYGGDERTKKLHRLVSTYEPQTSGSLELKVYKDFESSEMTLASEGSTADLSNTAGRCSRRLSGKRGHYFKIRWENENPNEYWKLRAATLVLEDADEPK